MPPLPRHWILLVTAFVIAACSPALQGPTPTNAVDTSPRTVTTSTTGTQQIRDVTTSTTVPSTTSTTTAPQTTTSPPAPTLGTYIGSALPEEPAPAGPKPVRLRIDDIDVIDAPVTDVGVLEDGDMEIPGAREVGWYRFGPSPGETGSAVLAAHIAFNGVDGVFRNLRTLEPGAIVEVEFDDGTVETFEVIRLEQYEKSQLPVDDLFAKTGEPRLTLITCGGDFNRSLRSYTDNVVAIARPVAR